MKILRAAVALLSCLPVLAWAERPAVHEFQLDNGLKLLVKEDHRAPAAVSQVWYKVGSSYEHEGVTGISHILEHMMFKGTEKHPPGEFSRIIAANGGRENAFTGADYTAYFQTLEKSRLEVSFELEADRMRHLRILPEEFAKEREVVMEERRMRTEDQPRAKLSEHFAALAHTNSPYRNPVIGWPDDIRAITVEDLRDWYLRWYAPNNATLVVVGDVEPQAVLELAKKHFGPLPPGDLPALKLRREVEQAGERRMTVKLPAKLPYLAMAYKVPALKEAQADWEPYALEVLAGVLDGGASARFSSRLVRGGQIAAEAGAGYNLYPRLPALFELEATPATGKSLRELEQALREEVRQVRDKPVAQAELERVKAQVLAQEVYQRDSMFYQAMRLGLLETVDLGWQRADEYPARIQAVKAEEVQAVARKYLLDEHLSVAWLEPLPIEAGKAVIESIQETGHVR
ncbi:MAG TPA: pitrilysin family protein [Methylococcaceae bacterium]|nr:pitrilysin family protein [Methylococcaceae bacterium]